MARNHRLDTLITPGASEEVGSVEFVDNFDRIYIPHGVKSPPFHIGTLADAVKTAWSQPAADVKLLVLYLHHEGNPLTKRFTRIFHSAMVANLLESHCVLWGWDVSSEVNSKTLLRIVSNNLGYDNAWRLQTIGKMMFPCFIFLSRTHKKPGIEIVQFFKASADLGFAASLFSNAVTTFCSKIRPQLTAREERNKTVKITEAPKTKRNDTDETSQSHNRPKSPLYRNVGKGPIPPAAENIMLNDPGSLLNIGGGAAYKTSVSNGNQHPSNYPYHSQDEAAKKRLAELTKQYLEAENERLKAEKKAILSRLVQENTENAIDDREAAWRRKLKTRDSSETKSRPVKSPRTKSERNLITLRFRSYKEVFDKTFNLDDAFEKVLLFLSSRGYSFREFKILAGWPRVDISEEDSRTPLKNLNFHARDNVILEKRKEAYLNFR